MSPHRATSLTIETPEGVEFSYDLASPAMRALAWMVDAAVITALSRGAGKSCEWLGKVNEDWANAISVLLYFASSVGYGIALEWRWHGQTLGKRVVGLRVVDAQGLRLQPSTWWAAWRRAPSWPADGTCTVLRQHTQVDSRRQGRSRS
jgi:uncharacterized RDD family membrane protein YckC